jgi:hypothetical protein
MEQMKAFTERVPEILEQCHERGLVLPYLVVAIAMNGSILALRCADTDKGIDAQVIASRMIDETMEGPINIMIVDGVGEACRVIITPAGAAFQ